MSTTHTHPAESPQTLDAFLAEPLRVGEPDVAGALAVFPIFAPQPRLRYLAFAQARSEGFRVGELEGGASVNDLLVENPTAGPVLLFEGEEVLGAQQNRTFDVSVLVAAGAKLRVPVSCVEAGRWEHAATGRRSRRRRRPPTRSCGAPRRDGSASASRPGWRRAPTRARSGTRSRAGRAARAPASPTGAMHDIYEERRDRLAEMQRGDPPPRRPGRRAGRDRRPLRRARPGQRPRRLRRPARPARPGLRARRAQRRGVRRGGGPGRGDRPRLHPARRRLRAGPPHARRSGSARSFASPPTASTARRSSTTAS